MKKVIYNTDQPLESIISYSIYNDEFVFFIYDSANERIYNTYIIRTYWNKYRLNDSCKKPGLTSERYVVGPPWLYEGSTSLNNILEECSDIVKKEILYNIHILECKDSNELRKLLAG